MFLNTLPPSVKAALPGKQMAAEVGMKWRAAGSATSPGGFKSSNAPRIMKLTGVLRSVLSGRGGNQATVKSWKYLTHIKIAASAVPKCAAEAV